MYTKNFRENSVGHFCSNFETRKFFREVYWVPLFFVITGLRFCLIFTILIKTPNFNLWKGTSLETPPTRCENGYHCPAGSPTGFECDVGFYITGAQKTECLPCREGRYCPRIGLKLLAHNEFQMTS